jgi:arsenite methyltransferase
VAGALTERDFVTKLGNAGFDQISVVSRERIGIERLALYPLFTAELLDLMRRLVPLDRQADVASAIVVTAMSQPLPFTGRR